MNEKILLVGGGLGPGGTERALVMLANKFSSLDYEVEIMLGYKTDIFYSISPEIKIHFPIINRDKVNYINYIIYLIRFFRNTIKSIKPDVILGLNDWIHPALILSNIGLKNKLIISDRTSPERNMGKLFRLAKSLLYPKLDGFIAQTQRSADINSKYIGKARLAVIPNPVNEINSAVKSKENWIISVGRLSKEKGHTFLLNAFSITKNKSWILHIVGDGDKRKALEEEAVNLNISDRVVFHGYKADFSELLCRSQIFVLPSLSEGFPNALIEAMSVPLACISFDCIAGPSEIIENNQNGILVPMCDTNRLACAIDQLIDDTEFRRKLSDNAFNIREKLNFDVIAAQYLKFLVN